MKPENERNKEKESANEKVCNKSRNGGNKKEAL